jgi:Holliday junction resolvase RusA-like endonuclease
MHNATIVCKDEAAWEARAQWLDPVITDPVDVMVYVLWPEKHALHGVRYQPDADALGGYLKPYFDGLNGIVWEDDGLVRHLLYAQERRRHDGFPNGAIAITIYEAAPLVWRL